MNIDSQTKLLGIIGYPIKHSLSPILHTTLAKNYNLNFVYLAFEVIPKMFKYIRNAIFSLDIKGLNITIPYKERIIPYLDELDKLAKKISAVNTVVNRDGKLIGYNTDVYGFIKSLEDENLKNKEAFVLGCGGVSKAVLCGLKEIGLRKAYVLDIDKKKMSQIKKIFGNFVVCVNNSDIKEVLNRVKIFVNATPLGMKENDPLPIDIKFLKNDLIVYDVIYNRETELIAYAKKIGCKTIDGISMFVYQAEQSFFLWTGIRPDVRFMFELVKNFIVRK